MIQGATGWLRLCIRIDGAIISYSALLPLFFPKITIQLTSPPAFKELLNITESGAVRWLNVLNEFLINNNHISGLNHITPMINGFVRLMGIILLLLGILMILSTIKAESTETWQIGLFACIGNILFVSILLFFFPEKTLFIYFFAFFCILLACIYLILLLVIKNEHA